MTPELARWLTIGIKAALAYLVVVPIAIGAPLVIAYFVAALMAGRK